MNNMNIKLMKFIDKIINCFCRFFRIRYAVVYRALSEEEVKALGLDKLELEKGQTVEKPTEM